MARRPDRPTGSGDRLRSEVLEQMNALRDRIDPDALERVRDAVRTAGPAAPRPRGGTKVADTLRRLVAEKKDDPDFLGRLRHVFAEYRRSDSDD